MTSFATGFDPAIDIRLDASTLRALAHPLRVRLLRELRSAGPATASGLGVALGESSGATSYHLRQLAAHGLVVEDTDRGTRRERWWRAAHRSTLFDMQLDDETRALGGEYLRAVAMSSGERLLAYASTLGAVEDAGRRIWNEASTISDWQFAFTAEQALELQREIFEVMVRHRDQVARGPGEATFVAQVQLFPSPEVDARGAGEQVGPPAS